MNAIEKALHHPILRVETKDFDEMEKVRIHLDVIIESTDP
jgi:hypothetical protein